MSCKFSNSLACATCNAENTQCLTCSGRHYLHRDSQSDTAGICKACQENGSHCIECSEIADSSGNSVVLTCTACQDGYFLAENACHECKAGYTKSDGNVISGISNARKCDLAQSQTALTLSECNAGFYVSAGGTCISCGLALGDDGSAGAIANCTECALDAGTSDLKCAVCAATSGNFKPNEAKTQCVAFSDGEQAISGCNAYSAANTCESCSNQHFSAISGCTTCITGYQGEQCDQCAIGYLNEDGSCIPCTTDYQRESNTFELIRGVLNCLSCNVPSAVMVTFQCTKCAENYYLDTDSNGFKTECSAFQNSDARVSNCEYYTNKTTCMECESGYYLYNNTCTTCTEKSSDQVVVGISNCSKCQYGNSGTGASSQLSCTQCESGYYLYGNTCTKCAENNSAVTGVTNCVICSISDGNAPSISCSQCNTGYYLYNNECILCSENAPSGGNAVSGIAGCSQCAYSDQNRTALQCSQCKDGYYLHSSICVKCSESTADKQVAGIENCRTCAYAEQSLTNLNCSQCESGYYLNENKCISCSLLPNTNASNIANCDTCIYNADHQSMFCSVCTEGITCQQCAPSYFNIGQICHSCKDNYTTPSGTLLYGVENCNQCELPANDSAIKSLFCKSCNSPLGLVSIDNYHKCISICESVDGTTKNSAQCACGDIACDANNYCTVSGGTGICLYNCISEDGAKVNEKKCKCGSQTCEINNKCSLSGDNNSEATCTYKCANLNYSVKNNDKCYCGTYNCNINNYCDQSQGDNGQCLYNCINIVGDTKNNDSCICNNIKCEKNNYCISNNNTGSCLYDCDNQNASAENASKCKCGSETCESNNYCNSNITSDSKCFYKCSNEDGNIINQLQCMCGSQTCQTNNYCIQATSSCYYSCNGELQTKCSYCSDSQVCKKCINQHKSIESNCTNCEKGYEGDQCQNCSAGYYYLDGLCHNCQLDYLQYSGITQCLVCTPPTGNLTSPVCTVCINNNENYYYPYLNGSKYTCQQFDTNDTKIQFCLAYSSKEKCYQCNNSLFSAENNCDSCINPNFSIISSCKNCQIQYSGKLCNQCSTNYATPTNGEQCSICLNNRKTLASECTKCEDKYTGDSCDKCTDAKYTFDSQCTQCSDLYNVECTDCANQHYTFESYCSTCKQLFTGEQCKQCANSAVFQGAECDICAETGKISQPCKCNENDTDKCTSGKICWKISEALTCTSICNTTAKITQQCLCLLNNNTYELALSDQFCINGEIISQQCTADTISQENSCACLNQNQSSAIKCNYGETCSYSGLCNNMCETNIKAPNSGCKCGVSNCTADQLCIEQKCYDECHGAVSQTEVCACERVSRKTYSLCSNGNYCTTGGPLEKICSESVLAGTDGCACKSDDKLVKCVNTTLCYQGQCLLKTPSSIAGQTPPIYFCSDSLSEPLVKGTFCKVTSDSQIFYQACHTPTSKGNQCSCTDLGPCSSYQPLCNQNNQCATLQNSDCDANSNCLTCLEIDKKQCATCESGRYLNIIEQTNFNTCISCSEIDKNCDSCHAEQSNVVCDSCNSGYFINSNNLETAKCLTCGSNCYQCQEADNCLQCNSGYFIDETKHCSPCPKHCNSCQSTTVCDTCDDDFSKKNGLCSATIPINLSDCTTTNEIIAEKCKISRKENNITKYYACIPQQAVFSIQNLNYCLDKYIPVQSQFNIDSENYYIVSNGKPILFKIGDYVSVKDNIISVLPGCINSQTPMDTKCICTTSGEKCTQQEICVENVCTSPAQTNLILKQPAYCSNMICPTNSVCYNIENNKNGFSAGSVCLSANKQESSSSIILCGTSACYTGQCINNQCICTEKYQSGPCISNTSSNVICTQYQYLNNEMTKCESPYLQATDVQNAFYPQYLQISVAKCNNQPFMQDFTHYCFDNQILGSCAINVKAEEKCVCIISYGRKGQNIGILVQRGEYCGNNRILCTSSEQEVKIYNYISKSDEIQCVKQAKQSKMKSSMLILIFVGSAIGVLLLCFIVLIIIKEIKKSKKARIENQEILPITSKA